MTEVLAADAPEAVGLSAAGLAKVDASLGALVAAGELAGVVTLVARRGRVVHRFERGLKDIVAGEPVAADTIFRIYSMTKPVMAAAMMILHDRGLWAPDDLLAKHLPEFADVRLLDGAAPARAPTMRDVMMHTAGLAYGFDPNDPVDAAYIAAQLWQSADLAEMMRKIAACPLAYEPGTRWRYSIAMDVQGAVLERLTGRTLPDFMREEIFAPLGMVDTDFFTPPDKAHRLAKTYRRSKTRGLVEVDQPLFGRDASRIPQVPSGGGGLYSTADDYARFAQMLLNRGELGGARILSPGAVALMTANHLSDEMIGAGYGIGQQQLRPGFGYGFNGAVFYDPPLAGSKVGRGTYLWDGAAGTWFWIDPTNDLLFVGLIQRLDPDCPKVQPLTQTLIGEALVG